MAIFNLILDNINTVLCTIVGIAFSFQLIYTLLFFLPAPKYPQAKQKHKVGIIICARNESAVIGMTLQKMLEQNYPKDKYEIIVVADNCTDNTAEIARSFDGQVRVRAIERHEPDKKKCNIGWALNYAFKQLMPEIDNFEFFVRFDADSLPDTEYLNRMNDAFESGVMVARGYNHASNLTQNLISGVSGLWYIRDNRFSCQARAALHTDTFLLGSGMMFAAKVIKDGGGWQATSSSEDTDFTIWNIDHKNKIKYVPDAVLYEDQPSTLNNVFRRNIRMGNSLHKLFWQKGWLCLGKFFTTFRYSYLDMFLNLLFIPIAVLCCLWFPAYYIYKIIFDAAVGNMAELSSILTTIAIILVCAFLIPFIAQAFLVFALDRKKIGVPFKKLWPTMLAFPMFMIIYAISIVIGVFSKPQWKQITRNVAFLTEGAQEKPRAKRKKKETAKQPAGAFVPTKRLALQSLKKHAVLKLARYPIKM